MDSLSVDRISLDIQIRVCEICREWCRENKRSFLRHRVELRLATLYMDRGLYQKALETSRSIYEEVKKLDDKLLLVEILVVDSKINILLNNLPKAKVSLTAAKSNANAIYCPALLQADIDMISGVINAQENDFKTAFSYFNEAFESLNQNNEKALATRALRYMLVSKIMADLPKDVEQIVSSKIVALGYASRENTDALVAVARAQKTRSIEVFENVVLKFKDDLFSDQVIEFHIRALNERLVEQNLLRIVEPYSRIEIDHIATLAKLPLDRVQRKLSDMILDGKLKGTLDQGIGVLIVFDSDGEIVSQGGSLYSEVIQTLENVGGCVDALFEKSKTIMATTAAV
jgi:26S proteasome regulatory subunit N6